MKSWVYLTLSIFLLVVGISLVTINSKNLTDFNLQHMTIEAITERRTVKLGGSYSPHLQPNGDILTYQGSVYPIKQPGTGFLGALAYFPLSKLGILYADNYLWVSAWVSVFTSSVIAGLIGVVIFWLCIRLDVSKIHAFLIALGSIFCTTIFPYTGFPHHDLIALLPVYLSLYLVLQGITKKKQDTHHDYFYLAGLCAGLSLFFSILPITLLLGLGLIILVKRGFWETVQFGVGAVFGIMPSLVYNYFVLGGFLHFPNLMGASVDTIPHLNLFSMVPNLLRYVTVPGLNVILFSPLAVLGLGGWISSKNNNRAWKILRTFVLLSTVLFAIHLSSFETEGDLQYGPRYLLPLIPLWFIGLKEYLGSKVMKYPLIIVSSVSFLINLLGALYGAMYKEISVFPLGHYLQLVFDTTDLEYPFRIYGLVIIFAVTGFTLLNRKMFKS